MLLQLHAHLNAVFAHFVEFNLRFQTVEEKELEVLEDLIVALKLAKRKAEEEEQDAPMSDKENSASAENGGQEQQQQQSSDG